MADLFTFLTAQLTLIVSVFSEGHYIYGVIAVAVMFLGYGLAAVAIDTAFRNAINRGFYVVTPVLATLSILVLVLAGASWETIKYAVYSAMLMLGMMSIAGFPCIQQLNKLRKIKRVAIKVNAPETVYTQACAKASLRYMVHPLCFILYVSSLKQYEQQNATPITHTEQQEEDIDYSSMFEGVKLFEDDVIELYPMNKFTY